jgi:hypothetical protein
MATTGPPPNLSLRSANPCFHILRQEMIPIVALRMRRETPYVDIKKISNTKRTFLSTYLYNVMNIMLDYLLF